MSLTHVQSISITSGTTKLPGTVSEVGGTESVIAQTIAASQTNLLYTFAITAANIQSLMLVSDKNLTIKTNGVNAVQSLAITGTPTGGTFTATFGGQTTAAIAYNASAATVQAALQLLSSIGAGNILCTGGPLPGTPVVCAFAGSLGLAAQSTITCASGSLTGGSSPTAAFTSTTTGVAPSQTISLVAGAPLLWSKSSAYFANPITADVTSMSFTSTAAATSLQGRILLT